MRFSKFSENYSSCRFVDALSFLNCNSFSRDEMNFDEGNYKNIHYGDILIKFPTLVDSKLTLIPFVNKNVVVTPKMNLLKDGDIVIADTAEDYTAGKAIELVVGKDKILSGLHTIPCRPRFKFSSGYLGYYLNSSSFRKNLLPLIQGIKVYSVSKYMFNSLYIKYPSLEEQQKVSDLLFKIDHRISTQNKIIRELFALKCGLCQMIKEKQKTAPVFLVKDICKIGRGRVISKAEIEKAESHTYPVFSSQTSNNGVMGYIDSYDFDGEYLTWTTDGANAGTVFYHNEKFNCTNVCGTLKIVNESINPYFLYLILENASQKYVSKNLANPKLMNDTMANIKVNIPDLKCQNNFVNVCKAIEKRIKVEEEIFRLLLDKKKFLLSNLFI